MIILELIPNSVKDAFPNRSDGKIEIQVKSVDQNNFILIVSDNGVGFPKGFNLKEADSLGI